MLKHTIEGTKEETFDDQSEMRHDHRGHGSHAQRHARGAAPVRQERRLDGRPDHARRHRATRSTARGWDRAATASRRSSSRRSCSSGKCDAKFILHVEKDTVWRRFNEDKFWRTHNCILTHGGGQPPRGVRRLLYRLHNELKLPVYCLLDNDPWGYYIYSVLKQGSINLAYESKRMAIPDARFLGLRSASTSSAASLRRACKINLNDQDIKRAKQIAAIPGSPTKSRGRRKST